MQTQNEHARTITEVIGKVYQGMTGRRINAGQALSPVVFTQAPGGNPNTYRYMLSVTIGEEVVPLFTDVPYESYMEREAQIMDLASLILLVNDMMPRLIMLLADVPEEEPSPYKSSQVQQTFQRMTQPIPAANSLASKAASPWRARRRR